MERGCVTPRMRADRVVYEIFMETKRFPRVRMGKHEPPLVINRIIKCRPIT